MESQTRIFESIMARLKNQPYRKTLLFALVIGCLTIIWLFPASIDEKGGQIASIEKPIEMAAKPDPELIEDGLTAYHRFQLNKTVAAPLEVGNCPGRQCYHFFLGPREIRKGKQQQTIFLGGGGFEKHLKHMPDGSVAISPLARLDHIDGSYRIPRPENLRSILGWGLTVPFKKGLIEATVYMDKGASLRLRAIDQDVLFVVEDDRINSLTVGVALYDGTFCTRYKEECVNQGIMKSNLSPNKD
ncbi:MAG: hypothetical protein QNI97_04725 [Desulfobacterales bacterium]|nr:hypothetical protein [Desulfobacterales bacterium]